MGIVLVIVVVVDSGGVTWVIKYQCGGIPPSQSKLLPARKVPTCHVKIVRDEETGSSADYLLGFK